MAEGTVAEPQSASQDAKLQRSQMVVALTITALVCLAFAAFDTFLGHPWVMAVLLVSFATALGLRRWAQRAPDSHLARVGHATIAILVLVVTLIALLRGQWDSYSVYAYVLAPLLAAHLLDIRAAIIWTAAAVASALVVFLSEDVIYIPADGELPTGFDKLYVLVLVLAASCAIAAATRHLSDRHQAMLGERERTIRRQADELELRVEERTRELARLNSELAHKALHDGLTGQANRALFLDHVAHAQARRSRTGTQMAVLFIDLDRFKVINDSLGHAAGDRILQEVAVRLSEGLRPTDVIARLENDEFAVLVEDLDRPAEALNVASRVHDLFQDPFDVDGHDVFVTTSIGIATSMEPAGDPEEQLRRADLAMNRAKRQGRNRSETYDDRMRAAAVRRMETENALHRAVECDELRVVYQPIVDVRSSSCVGFEALLRWQREEGELVGAGDFIDVAEETGLIVPMGDWILRTACEQARNWRDSGGEELSMHVNLSALQVRTPDLGSVVSSALSPDLDPAALCLEITETALMDSTGEALSQLKDLKALGVRLALDDFGTGYSSLSHLRRFPIDVLKVDKMFIDGLGTDGESATLVSALIGLAHSLDLKVVAEGVEMPVQAEALKVLGCDLAQGYHYGRPAPADTFTESVFAPTRRTGGQSQRDTDRYIRSRRNPREHPVGQGQ